ncbi:MAG TPA: glycosyltransferase [Rubrobacteraceae bacterium]|nr:glycosyltransferase [Rubrobacteraceae bacterium]
MGKLVTDEDGEGSDTEGVSVERTARGTESLMTNAPDIKPPVIIISGIRWDFLWQRHQIFATLFARAGYPTVYVETTGLRNPSFDPGTARIVIRRIFRAGSKARKTLNNTVPNLAVYSPLVAPPTWKIFRHLNRTVFVPRVARDLRHLLNGVSPAVIAYPPTSTTLDLLSNLEPCRVLYDCVLNYEHFPGVPRDIAETEKALLRRADAVTVDSGFLLEKHRHMRPDAAQIGPGVDYELFERARAEEPLWKPARTVCFFGGMDESRFDFDLVRELAEEGCKVRLLGTLSQPALARLPGIEYRGEVPHQELPRHLADIDALIIPYKINTFSKGTFPAKTFECLATGKPTITTPLPDLVPFGDILYLRKDARGFADVLRRLPEFEDEQKVQARIELARKNSWEARFAALEKELWKKR